MARFYVRLMRTLVLGTAILVLFGCGGGTVTVVQGGGTNVPAPPATPTHAPPTATPKPTNTPTPGHLLVNIKPNPPGYYGGLNGGTSEYTCHSGTTCAVDGPCTSPNWPTFILNNTGQTSLTWNATVSSTPGGWGLSATSGSIAGGGAKSISMTNGPGGGSATYVFQGPGQTITINAGCGAG